MVLNQSRQGHHNYSLFNIHYSLRTRCSSFCNASFCVEAVFCREQLWLFRRRYFGILGWLGEKGLRYGFAGNIRSMEGGTAERSLPFPTEKRAICPRRSDSSFLCVNVMGQSHFRSFRWLTVKISNPMKQEFYYQKCPILQGF